MDTHTQHLDGEELFHLALAAGMEGQHEKAISLLKQAWSQDPRNALILYCLGAEHAQIGMYERAMAEMERAIEMEPALDTARLQLGLLCFTCGLPERGEAALQALLDRPEDDCMGHFARGLTALAHDDLPGCQRAVEQGMRLNTANGPLNDDMARLMAAVQENVTQAQAQLPPAGPGTPGLVREGAENERMQPDTGDNLWMSSYRKVGSGR